MPDTDEPTPTTDAPPAEAAPELTPMQQALQDFLASHSPHKAGHAANANGSWETDETVYCQCPLCVAGREALGV